MQRFCCHISHTGHVNADVMIVSNTGHPEDYTDSCLEHVGLMLGLMLGSITNQPFETYTSTIVPIEMAN